MFADMHRIISNNAEHIQFDCLSNKIQQVLLIIEKWPTVHIAELLQGFEVGFSALYNFWQFKEDRFGILKLYILFINRAFN